MATTMAVKWRIEGQRIPAPDHSGQRTEDETERDGEDEYAGCRLADNTAHDLGIDKVAQNTNSQATEDERGPETPAHRLRPGQYREGAQHHELAVGEIDDLGGLVDQYEAERNEPVGATLRKARNCQVHEIIE